MMHSINEVYRIPTKKKVTYTYTYCTKAYIEANGIEIGTAREGRVEGKAYKVHSIVAKSFKLHDVNEVKRVYLYGEHTWFDTEDELNKYRENN